MTAQINPIDLVAPGSLGLNFAQAGNLLPPAYATVAQNAVIDESGRLAARLGSTLVTTTPIAGTPDVEAIFEYRRADGTSETVISYDGGISNDLSDPVANDISGAVTDTDGRWWFQNFNDKLIGFQEGQKPIIYEAGGSFATVVESAGIAPSPKDGVALAAYGRLWVLDADGHTIQYCSLLDETEWGDGNGTAGQIDMSQIWTDGTDTVKGLWAFNGTLLVFGLRHIVVIADSQSSALGLNPLNAVVVDVIEGTGTLTQWSIQPVGETDLLYLSRNGVQSIQRVTQERSNPVANRTKLVRDQLNSDVLAETDIHDVRSAFSPENGFYLLSFPSKNRTWVLDQRRRYIDADQDELSVITTWTISPTAWSVQDDGTLYIGSSDGVLTYSGADDNGVSYRYIFESPWLDLGEELGNRLKILKRIGSIFFVTNNTDVVYKWATDFEIEFNSLTRTLTAGGASEWDVGEWAVSEWGGGLALRQTRIPASSTGQYFRLRVEAVVTGILALQQLELFPKIGRIA